MCWVSDAKTHRGCGCRIASSARAINCVSSKSVCCSRLKEINLYAEGSCDSCKAKFASGIRKREKEYRENQAQEYEDSRDHDKKVIEAIRRDPYVEVRRRESEWAARKREDEAREAKAREEQAYKDHKRQAYAEHHARQEAFHHAQEQAMYYATNQASFMAQNQAALQAHEFALRQAREHAEQQARIYASELAARDRAWYEANVRGVQEPEQHIWQPEDQVQSGKAKEPRRRHVERRRRR